jgi:thioredoxin-related protein
MTKLKLGLFFAVLLLAVPASGLDYNDALKAAKQENKPVVLYFYSNSCYYCRLMDKNTLGDKDVAARLKKDFVFFRINTDKSSDLALFYQVRGTPLSWFLESTGRPIQQIPGYVEKADYQTLLDYVGGGHYKKIDIQDYFKRVTGKK